MFYYLSVIKKKKGLERMGVVQLCIIKKKPKYNPVEFFFTCGSGKITHNIGSLEGSGFCWRKGKSPLKENEF